MDQLKVDFSAYLQQIETIHAMQTCAIVVLGTGRNTDAAHKLLTEVAVKLSGLQDAFEEISETENVSVL